MKFDDFISVLNVNVDSIEFKKFIEDLGGQFKRQDFDDSRSYVSVPSVGLDFVFDDQQLSSIQFFNDGIEPGSSKYHGELPFNLTMADSKKSVVNKMGAPAQERDGVDDSRPFVHRYPWVKYLYLNYSVHITFSMNEGSIRMFTLSKLPS